MEKIMNKKNQFRKFLIIIIIMIISLKDMIWFCDSCLDSEKIGLLQFKEKFPFNQNSSWGLDDSSDCCTWEGVECNSTTKHVIGLHLFRIRGLYEYDQQINGGDNWYLNVSLFLPFRQLKKLNLRGNKIAGCIHNEGFERLSTITNMEILDLSSNHLNNTILQSLSVLPSLKSLYMRRNRLNGTINISDLSNLTSLKELDISENEIEGFATMQGFKGPTNLSILYLEGMTTTNGIRNLLPQSLGLWPSIKTLSLIANDLRGKIFGEESHYHESKVEEVILDYCSVDDTFLQGLSKALPSVKLLSLMRLNGTLPIAQGFPIFGSLEHLYLNDSGLNNNNSFLQSIGRMKSLKTLSLQGCGLSGNLPAYASQGLCQLKHIQQLDMKENELTGNLPSCLANLTSLQMLDLSYNHFSGDIAPLRSLTSLRYLDLSDNLFEIPISLAPFFNHSQLKFLNVRHNTLYAESVEDHNLNTKFQLEVLIISGYLYGRDSIGEVPRFLYHQNRLREVSISNVKLRGEFPYWLLENNTRLEYLHLTNNSLSGSLQLPKTPHVPLMGLFISDNFFLGCIPSEIGAYFPKLRYFQVSGNRFNGSIPSSMGNMSLLESLDLSNHSLSGEIPDSLCNIYSLKVLDISLNNISGKIPKCVTDMGNLTVLDLSHNNITGSLPPKLSPSNIRAVLLSRNRIQGSLVDAMFYSNELFVLDLSHNNFTGRIPSWIERFSQLSYLLLSHNDFEGDIPVELCKLNQLSLLDLSHNNLSARIPPCLKFSSYWDRQQQIVSFVNTLEFTIKGNLYSLETKILSCISGIDLSSNKLTGRIPSQIGNLGSIQVLNLSHNSLTGTVPTAFSNLQKIESLDLSYNHLQGILPDSLAELNFLAVFNVSYNNLSGRTPKKVAQFATFDESSYKGNPFLCGWPLPNNCNAVESPPSLASPYDEESSNSFIDTEAFYTSFGIAYGMVLSTVVAVLCINPYWRRVWFYYVQISIDNSYYFVIDNVPFLSRFKLS